MDPEIPSRDGSVTATCPVCRTDFVPAPNQVYCKHACGAKAWRRRHQRPVPAVVVPPGVPRRPLTVYECEACGIRSLGSQRCEDCGSFMRRVGLGGRCPHCLFSELLTGGEGSAWRIAEDPRFQWQNLQVSGGTAKPNGLLRLSS